MNASWLVSVVYNIQDASVKIGELSFAFQQYDGNKSHLASTHLVFEKKAKGKSDIF